MRRKKKEFVNPSWNDLEIGKSVELEVDGRIDTYHLVRTRNAFSSGRPFDVVYLEDGKEKLLQGIALRSGLPIQFSHLHS